MCIVFYTVSQPGYQLSVKYRPIRFPQTTEACTGDRILASNRDEYFDRPALQAKWHTFDHPTDTVTDSNGRLEPPWVLSGRDLGSSMGGTWLGMTRDLRIGIV